MTIRSLQPLKLAAVFISVASYSAFAQIQASSATAVAPLAASAPTAVPALVPFSGVALDRDGHARSGATAITFLIFKDQTGGESLFTETQSVVLDATGHYTAHLGASMTSGLPLDLFSSGEARWLEVQIAGEGATPRILLASVPYALKAVDATTLGGLPASAFALVGAKAPAYTATAALPGGAITEATSTVTTTGGTTNKLAKFSGTSTIVNSILFDNGTEVGIGTTAPSATLTVNGTTTLGGQALLPAQGTATASGGFNSQAFKFNASSYSSSSKAAVSPRFALQAEFTGNNTASPNATLNLVASPGTPALAETGFYINTNGIVHFATGQTFPGGGGSAGAAMCIATGGGFGSGGGTTFIAPNFVAPAGGGCSSWSGFTKTATTVVLTTSGAACLSTDGKKITLSVSSADPDFLGAGTQASDYIQITRTGTTGTFTSGSDQGEFSGSANQVTCTASLLQLNENND